MADTGTTTNVPEIITVQDDAELTTQPDTDPTKTTRFAHPKNFNLLSLGEKLFYTNQQYIAQQNRQTHRMLQQVIAGGYGRQRSASASSAGSSIAEELASDFNFKAIFAAHKKFLTAEFGRWITEKKNVVRKNRGTTGKAEAEAAEFLGAHLDEVAEETPAELKPILADLATSAGRETDRVNLFLTASRAYAEANPKAPGTKSVSGNRRGAVKNKTRAAPARGRKRRRVDDSDDEDEDGEEDGAREGGGDGAREGDEDYVGERVGGAASEDESGPSRSTRRGSQVTIQTDDGVRNPASSF